jgi:hypothetical protein
MREIESDNGVIAEKMRAHPNTPIPKNNNARPNSMADNVISKNNNNQLVSSILVDIFKISRADLRWLESQFNLKTIELIYPKSVNAVRSLKRCVIGVKFKLKPAQSAAIKLEFDQQVRARFDDHSHLVTCGTTHGVPTERFIYFTYKYIKFSLMQSNFFLKFWLCYFN